MFFVFFYDDFQRRGVCGPVSLARDNNIKILIIRQASGLGRVQIPLYLVPHALLFLSWFFFLSAVPFFLLTRTCTWGRPLGGRGSRKSTTRARLFCPLSAQNRTLGRFSDFLKLLKGYIGFAGSLVWFLWNANSGK